MALEWLKVTAAATTTTTSATTAAASATTATRCQPNYCVASLSAMNKKLGHNW